MRKLSRHKYAKAMDCVIYGHWIDFSGQPNESLMMQIVESERHYRKEAWTQPLAPDTFAGAPVPAHTRKHAVQRDNCTLSPRTARGISFWNPLDINRLHRNSVKTLTRSDVPI